jgi:lipopolysaccharide export LptBFGC system permease protein LptF
MSRPGDRLRALAARLFDAQAMERLIDPVVADLQTEYGAAVRAGRTCRSRQVRVAGYVALVKVIAVCGWRGATQGHRDWTTDDRRALVRMFGCLVVTVAISLLLELPRLMFFLRHPLVPTPMKATMLVTSLPQALTCAVPVGLTLGIVFGLGGRVVSRRLTGAVLGWAVVCSIGLFCNLGWLVPTANQAFRVAMSARADTPPGLSELSIREIGSRLDRSRHGEDLPFPGDVRSLAFNYHYIWAFSCAPLVLALLGLSVVARRSLGRLTLVVAVFGAFLTYRLLLTEGRTLVFAGAVPVYVGVWLPHVSMALMALVVGMRSTPSAVIAR